MSLRQTVRKVAFFRTLFFAVLIGLVVLDLPSNISFAQTSAVNPHAHVYLGFVKRPDDRQTTSEQWEKLGSVMTLIRRALGCSDRTDDNVYCDSVDQRDKWEIPNDWKMLSKFGVTHFLIAVPERQNKDSII